ncbi:cytochrome P450, partial [Mycena latifolia]
STIPAIGGCDKNIISSYMTALHFLNDPLDVIHRGYCQYRDAVFRVPTLGGWDYIANGLQYTNDIAAAPEHILSLHEAFAEASKRPYIMTNPIHITVIRGSVTRNLGQGFAQMRDEIEEAFNDIPSLEGEGWKEFDVSPNVKQVVVRAFTSFFIGIPLCENQEYVDFIIDYTKTLFSRGTTIDFLPNFLKPVIGPLLSTRGKDLQRMLKFLGPMIEERLENEENHGPPPFMITQSDLISWLINVAEGEERTTPALAQRILTTYMIAIPTTSAVLTKALYDLAAYPEHILPMREEAQSAVSDGGWTRNALANMHKIDSFLRESLRLSGSAAVSMTRWVLAKDGFTFSDGTHIPYGTRVSIPGNAIHYDPDNYENAAVFDGFRFARQREHNEGNSSFNRHMISTSPDHVAFSYGHRACPGRFLASTQVKAIMAHILINYDVKAQPAASRKPDRCIEVFRIPDPQGKILIKKRVNDELHW